MFTGIIKATGKVGAVSTSGSGRRLMVDMERLNERPVLGGSVAISGVCLTVVAINWPAVWFDVVSETLSRTTLGRLGVGDSVNLELPLKADDRVEGHFVQGHVDTTCRIVQVREDPPGRRMYFEPVDREQLRYIMPKGSVAIDGISLTVAQVSGSGFSVALIPETLERTTIGGKSTGELVNLETDILIKGMVHRERPSGDDADESLMALLRRSGIVD